MPINPDRLEEILRLHLLWLEQKDGGKCATLLGEDLTFTDLSGRNLSGAKMHAAFLDHANLSNSKLHGTHLLGTSLIKSNLIGADLSDAQLIGANLTFANFTNAVLDRVDWTGANMYGVIGLSQVELRRITLEAIGDQVDMPPELEPMTAFESQFPESHRRLRKKLDSSFVLVQQWLMILRAVVEHKSRVNALKVLPFQNVDTITNNLRALTKCLGDDIYFVTTNEKKQRELAFTELGNAIYEWAKRHSLGALK